MLICKVCERAAESIIDELAIFALTEKYPEHLALLIDGLIDLTDFEWEQNQIELGNAGRDDHISGGSFIYKLLSSTYLQKHYKSPMHMENYTKLIIHMCSVNDRLKRAFILDMEDPECGIEAFRFELGDAVADLCTDVMSVIINTRLI